MDANGRLIRSVADRVIAVSVDVDLITRVRTELRGEGRRDLERRRRDGRRVIVFFERLLRYGLATNCLTGSCCCEQRTSFEGNQTQLQHPKQSLHRSCQVTPSQK